MRKCLFIFFVVATCIAHAQIRISGKVLDNKNTPLEGATVYLNNTSIGTTTNHLGEFGLQINEGVYDLIVSYLGYETIRYQIDTNKPNKRLTFKTKAANNLLDEIVIRSRKYSAKERALFIARFKNAFIGTTKLAKECKILNEDVLYFDYEKENHKLKAFANEPIEILHKGLGYKLYFDLLKFELDNKKFIYLGYSQYKKIKGSKREQSRWEKNRLKAFHGSEMHLVRALIKTSHLTNEMISYIERPIAAFKQEGFVIDKVKRILNPERPSDSIITEARKYLSDLALKSSNTKNVGYSFLNLNNKEQLREKDSAQSILRKSRRQKFIYITLKEDFDLEDFALQKTNNDIRLEFKNYIRIKYLKEKEEYGYRLSYNRLDHQVSFMTLFTKNVVLDEAGVIMNPYDYLTEGYWSYEKVADALPLDYIPKE